MQRFDLYLEDRHLKTLRTLAHQTGLSVAEHVRRAVDAHEAVHGERLSGAVVLGVVARTTSGDVWIGKGY
jgi:predicted transcriptional regulator